MSLDYEVLCYRVMFRFSFESDFYFEDFSTVEKALSFLATISSNPNVEYKMLKVFAFVVDL